MAPGYVPGVGVPDRYHSLVPVEQWSSHLPAGQPFSPEDLLAGGTLPAVWSARWAAQTTAPVLLDETPGAIGEPARWCVAGEFDERTRAEAGRLAAAGLGVGDRFLWCSGPSLASVVTSVAALRLGAVVVPANPAYSARELVHIVADVRRGRQPVHGGGATLLDQYRQRGIHLNRLLLLLSRGGQPEAGRGSEDGPASMAAPAGPSSTASWQRAVGIARDPWSTASSSIR